MSHYTKKCKYGFRHATCRCAGPKEIQIVECDKPLHQEVRRTSFEWAAFVQVQILDPDGWRRMDGVEMDTPITFKDFQERLAYSTANYKHYLLDIRELGG